MTTQVALLTLSEAERLPMSHGPSETALFEGYRIPSPVIRRVRCACGDWLVAPAGDDAATLAAVATHNESTAHQQWRARREDA